MSLFTQPPRLLAALAIAVVAPAVARAQQPTASPAAPPAAVPASTPAAAPASASAATAPVPGAPIDPKSRRTVEIRAQAPAPEVITVRPREVPQYTRRLLAPSLLTFADSAGAARAGVVVPAPASAEVRAAAASDRRTRTP